MITDGMFSRNGNIVEVCYELQTFDPSISGYPAKVFLSINEGEPVHLARHVVLRNLPGGSQMWKDCGSGVMYNSLSNLVNSEIENLAYYL